ncbi:MAG TPA: PAS domain S-box protein [Pyrinomonadaceae bacterium]|nr:PAS domain S-box protein [Pyrinomonadaceae bacterium]
MWLMDATTRTTYVNRQTAELLGYTVEEIHGRLIFDFIFENAFSALERKIEQIKHGDSERGEARLRRKDGSTIIALYSVISTKNQAGEITGFLLMMFDITERKKADRLLRLAEANYRNLVESSPVIVYLAEPFPPFAPIYVSPNINWFGYTTEEWFEKPDTWLNLIHEEDREYVLSTTEAAMQQGLDTDLEYRIISRDGTIYWLHDKGRFVSDDKGKRVGWQGVIIDVTETKRLEEQLKQSQKLESVGRLAGGIAHDFNNMLTAINGYSELTLRALESDNPLRHNIEEIKKAGERSALLTHQLLAFSRRQVLQPVVLDLNEIITDTSKMLERMIGEDVELVIALEPETGLVNVDPGQLSQIIMNLAVNARDAMPQGGRLTIETANIFLEPDDARQKVGILPGAYVMLAVCDTGDGIDDKILQHIFEPFFTTKNIGKGTGLGLSTVYGIVKQSGGNIEVDSKVGAGATFRIYLPRVAEQSEAAEIKDTSAELPSGTETILLVEDEELVRNLSREILETCGYTVIEARNGLEALEVCENGNCKINLLMTDVVMPQMGGRELAEKLTEKLPSLKILFTSGYTNEGMVRNGVIETSTNFIQKPFTFDALARKVRELLDA